MNNKSLNTIFESYSICEIQHSIWKTQILHSFSGYVDESSFKKWHLCLYKFATVKPLIFFRRKAIDQALAFFNQHPDLTLDGVATLQRELSHAILSLFRPGASWTKEEKLSLDRPEQMIEFESIWHPEYQRYCEHIFNHLIKLILYIIGSTKSKNYFEQKLFNRVDIMRTNGLTELTAGYDSVVRNAISHGSTSFELTSVKYIDEKDNKIMLSKEFADLFDNLVYTCHSILIALLLFLCEKQNLVETTDLNKLPMGLRFIFIDAFSSHSGFKLLSAMESDTISSKRQLNIVCKIDAHVRWAQMYEGMHTCWNASNFGGADYNRFSISFDCGMPVLSSLFLNGDELQRAIKLNDLFDRCVSKIIESALLWYDTSSLRKKLYYWKCIKPVWRHIMKEEIAKNKRRFGLTMLSSCYKIIGTFNESTETVRKVEAHVILLEKGDITDKLLQDIMRHAISNIRKHRVCRTNLYGEVGWARKPNYIIVKLFAQERRVRTLMSYGWKDKDLVLVAECIASSKKIKPFYTQEADAVWGRIRIKYNPNLVQMAKTENR